MAAGDADSANNDEQEDTSSEPSWDGIMAFEPASTEVPKFLTALGRRNDANGQFATGLDIFHESVQKSMEGLVEVVSALLNSRAEKLYEFEIDLKNDYVYNEKSRANMNAKLEESARVAQGLFANLLMRVAQPGDDASSATANALAGVGGANGNSGSDANANNNNGNDPNEDPEWDKIMMHEPAKSEVPTFLAARGRREAACARFESAIEEFQGSIDMYAQEITQTVADLYNNRETKLSEYEQVLKHDYVENDKKRAEMQNNLEQSATAAHDMFQDLLMRVMQPGLQHQPSMEHQQQPMGGMLTQATTLHSP